MEEYIHQEKIHILTKYSQKIQWEKQLRYLWKTCFGDPQHYEDFYFDKVYANNKVYAIEDKGMIHLNSYRCKVTGKDMLLPYIVGVATDARYRRQGIMRSLMDRVLVDLYEQKVPFTYLMPANEEYYKSFGFWSVSRRQAYEWKLDDVVCTKRFQYLSYEEMKKLPGEAQLKLLKELNRWLEQRYDVYAIHDEVYFDLLYEEKKCQSGDVVFCFDSILEANHLCGMFAYAMDGEIPYVEQVIVKDQTLNEKKQMIAMLGSFFTKCTCIKIAQSYPFMLRIVHREVFLELFGEKLSGLCGAPMEELSDEQIMKLLFQERGSIYFAEIV